MANNRDRQQALGGDTKLSLVVRALFERERVVIPVPAEIRDRALARARACLVGTLSNGRTAGN